MSSTYIYDFMTGARIHLPTVLNASAAIGNEARYGVRVMLRPGEDARSLMREQLRILSALSQAAQ